MIPERSLEVLRAIVHDYIETSQPVGSKTLVERHAFGVSSATIRNEMALLEDEQLIVAPHTSSGRVPTDKGYRLFVDRLGEVKPLSVAERTAIETFMQGSADLDEVGARFHVRLGQLSSGVLELETVDEHDVGITEQLRHRRLGLEGVAVGALGDDSLDAGLVPGDGRGDRCDGGDRRGHEESRGRGL